MFRFGNMLRLWLVFKQAKENATEASSVGDNGGVTPRGRRATSLDDAVVSDDSRSNQDEPDTEAAKQLILDMLRITTDARVHIADTRVHRVGLYTDFILSTDSCAEPNRSRIIDYVRTQMNPELYEVFEAQQYVPNDLPGFPVQHHTLSSTLVVRKHAVLLVYTPCRYWFSRFTLMVQCLVFLCCMGVILYMLRF